MNWRDDIALHWFVLQCIGKAAIYTNICSLSRLPRKAASSQEHSKPYNIRKAVKLPSNWLEHRAVAKMSQGSPSHGRFHIPLVSITNSFRTLSLALLVCLGSLLFPTTFWLRYGPRRHTVCLQYDSLLPACDADCL